jgi:ribosome-associated protein
MKIAITPAIAIDDNELAVRFIRSGGPGGQHVNKVSTGVQLRFDVANSEALPDDVRARAMLLAGQRLNLRGEVMFEATRHRSQDKNRQDALDRLVDLLRRAAVPPKLRRKTRPPRGVAVRRLDGKRRRGSTKALRRTPADD